MTMLDTLFGLIPAASRGQQWLAEDLQLVNWGGYDGAHRVRFSPGATLLCGGSGSGKSTLMDAYIALMMPHTTPFNGASNGGVTGRPRGEDQRNILSYARGKLDESRTDEGTAIRVLRGDGTDTWTAVAMTWVDHDGSRFSAVRAWYVPAGARVLDDTVRVRASVEGSVDLGALEAAAALRFSDASLRSAGLDPLATDREFSARLHAVLGIGAAGAGAKAMSLLARIQAGQQITTVDDLYKRLVLEEPETLATADAVVAHFDELESTRTRMMTARQQVAALEPLRDLRVRLAASAERLRLIDALGDVDAPSSPAAIWRAEQRLGLLRDVEAELRERSRATDTILRERRALAEAAEAERDALVDVLRLSGGERLETAQRELRDVERRLATVRQNRARLDEDLRALGHDETTRTGFEAVLARASDAGGASDAKRDARAAWSDAVAERKAAEHDLAELEAESRRASTSGGSIPRGLHEARERAAEAAGLAIEDVPFVGELVDVRTEFEPWREAFTLALGGFATTLMIDVSHLERFRDAIDVVRLPTRLRYEGVHTGLEPRAGLDPRTLPGRLDYRATPFTGWLQERLVDRFGFVCVDRPGELGRHRIALTLAGQLSQGQRGAHGGHGAATVLGFSNARRLRDLGEQLERARGRREAAMKAAHDAEAALDALDDHLVRLGRIVEVSWESVDVDAVLAERDRWLAVQAEVSAANPEVSRLQGQIAELRLRAERLRDEIARTGVDRERSEEQWAAIVDDVDASQETLDAAERAGRELADDQRAFLDARFALTDAASSGSAAAVLVRFDAALATGAQRLAEERRTAAESREEQRESVARIMTAFLDRWPNPNLLVDPDASLDDFERLLEALETSGLHRLEAEWRDSLLTLSGNDLTNLDSTLSRSLREIRERIEPINVIMQDLPFSDDAHRLQITTRENQSEVRRRFRRELREVRAQIEAASTEEEREQVYRRMARLIGRMRRTAPDFGDLVDVRNHVRVSAERVDAATRQHVALYDHIGEKSGGESQELIAFIVGAALRYQLGDAGADRPRYAPVFMDEALIKADAHFTKRAIGAWRGLGFQLVIGAPNDKYSAIEPHVEVEYDILKDTRGRSWARLKVGLPEEA
ncbi:MULTISPECIES: ATP-binding protein [unclassified Rathayibacter]|uniref:ATP-binding protein n=1 Tax=unclassified Rathayibacter TaxID=2609250 RepID=UPI00188D3685|nr:MULTISPECIES: SbcC/MukB-like Walker B domain-containing protein [unclassified Rathayibacter]MBF4462589.1 AAA family ATPase [Rathayibacter sp. VKM Ac-2879]MBF4503368.1 AAA family ATPase [Rathayibacter sp. VKM Ac-2878]